LPTLEPAEASLHTSALSGAALAEGTGAIGGRVTDAVSGLPVADVVVDVFDSEARLVTRSTTNANGDYVTGDGLAPGTYYARTSDSEGHIGETYDDLLCQAFCSVVAGAPITVTADTTTGGIDFALDPGHMISGRVTDAGNADRDRDGAGDACDAFPDDPRAGVDSDEDGVGDEWEARHDL
jgi:hypothetical protein